MNPGLGKTRWSASSKEPTVSVLPVLELQMCTDKPSFQCECWESECRSSGYMVRTLLMEPTPARKHYFITFHHRNNVGKYEFKYHFPIKPPYCLLGYYYGKLFVNFYTSRNM